MAIRSRLILLMLVGAVAAACCVAAQAQVPREPRIGFLYGGVGAGLEARANAFREGVEGDRHPVRIVARVAEGDPTRLPALAAELLAERVDVIFAAGPAAVRAAHAAAPNLAVVALDLETDPVAAGLVSSVSRPGGHLTGVFFDFPDFSTKWLELLREISPGLTRLGVLWDPSTGPLQLRAVERVAGTMRFQPQVIEVKDAAGLPEAFRRARAQGAEGLLLLSSPIFGSVAAVSARLALEHGFPAISMFPEFAEAGGLVGYGPNVPDLYRQSGVMVAKVLAGAAPAELPVDRPSRFQLIVNLKTARLLGIDIPPVLLLRADEVVE